MYNFKSREDLEINSRLLLNCDRESLEKLLMQYDCNPVSLEETLRVIHDWYQRQAHLPKGQLHDILIVKQLLMSKFNIENVKQRFDKYGRMWLKMPEILKNRDPMKPNLNTYLKTGYWMVLPKKTPDNCRVTMFRIKSSDGVSAVDLMKAMCMVMEYRVYNDSVLNDQVILDCENITLQLALQMTPVLIWKITYLLLECVGAKIKGIHIINLPSYCEVILTLFKKLMKAKLVNRMHFYKSFDEVFRKFPESIFPTDLGGTDDRTCKDITDAWERTLCSSPWRNYFMELDSVHTVHSEESKRKNRKNLQDDFGVDGSFRKLIID